MRAFFPRRRMKTIDATVATGAEFEQFFSKSHPRVSVKRRNPADQSVSEQKEVGPSGYS